MIGSSPSKVFFSLWLLSKSSSWSVIQPAMPPAEKAKQTKDYMFNTELRIGAGITDINSITAETYS